LGKTLHNGIEVEVWNRALRTKDIVSADELPDIARESWGRLVACSMSMQVMGIRENKLTTG